GRRWLLETTASRVLVDCGEWSWKVWRCINEDECRVKPRRCREAERANVAGTASKRGMMLEVTGDPACDYLDCQYML
ncbi:hypothetical protein, partial [Salmonella enterica]|uniref:hypothetical protein n=1 Tax=Salmonella enterica TaxID=28901 RepID=UPI00398C69C4